MGSHANSSIEKVDQRPSGDRTAIILFVGFLLISCFPFLYNLDAVGFIEDEGIRNLVALEMQISGNYIAPTLFGDPYLNKPPLWNWILILTYKLTGGASVFNARLATLFFLYLFAISVFLGFKRKLGLKTAIYSALVLLTCGRIIFWDSMLSLIDICFSWVIFCLFLWVYHAGSRKQWPAMFIGAYAIATVGFFLKALPALVFLGLTILIALWYWRALRQLFSFGHVLGFLLLSSILGVYLLAYSAYFPVDDLLLRYLNESTKRTVAEHGVLETILHLLAFPLEMLYHFLPWSLLVFLLFTKPAFRMIRENNFLRLLLLFFIVNIWVYWTSPNVFPRYLFMFFPLFTGPALYVYSKSSGLKRISDFMLIFFSGVLVLASFLPLFIHSTRHLPDIWIKSPVLASLFALVFFLLLKFPAWRIIGFCLAMLVFRFAFDWIVLPSRAENSRLNAGKDAALEFAEQYHDEEVKILRFDHLSHASGFYLTNQWQRIIQQSDSLIPGTYMLAHPDSAVAVLKAYSPVDTLVSSEKNKSYVLIRVE